MQSSVTATVDPKEREEALGVRGWAVQTPGDCGYRIYMWLDSNGENLQEIDLTRDEYLALKEHLARMRGLLPASATEAGNHARN